MKSKYLGHTIKRTRDGRYRIPRLGGNEIYPTRSAAKEAIAAVVFPYRYVGGPPIKSTSQNSP